MKEDYFEYKNNFNKYENIKSKLILGNKNRKEVLFTIAIPTYKRVALLENALKSALDQQGVEDYEIIIVDNDTENYQVEEMIKNNYNEKVYYFKNEKNIGMFGNWNRCIELARGKYITILNDDDWLSENYLNNCIKHLKREIDGLYFDSNQVDFRNDRTNKKNAYIKKIVKKLSKKQKKLTLFDFFLGNKSAGTLGVLLKTQYLKELGGYNDEYFPSSDYVLHANYCNRYNVYYISKKMNYYRIQENESAKQETLRKWEIVDNEIRKYFINKINRNNFILNYINTLLQENRIEGLIKFWNYDRNIKYKHNMMRKILEKIIIFKNYMNI